MVRRLVYLRADVNFQFKIRKYASPLGLLMLLKTFQHRFGKASAWSAHMYHLPGMTPLMAALQSAQFEGAAALIAAGARLQLKNCRGWTAVNFTEGQVVPGFVAKGLKGDASDCHHVCFLAMSAGYGGYKQLKI